MYRTTLLIAILFVTFFANIDTASAHQPHYIGTETAIEVPDADTSRAYYGELSGQPAIYTIASDKDFTLYVNVLSPDLPDAKKDFTVQIKNAGGSDVATLNLPSSEWQRWYEEFAGDSYWKGPEFKQTVPAGTYTLTVSNPENKGKYVLAPGEAEVFTLAGMPDTIKQIYLTKTLFFKKPWYALFEGIIGNVLLGFVSALIVGAAIIVTVLLRRRRA